MTDARIESLFDDWNAALQTRKVDRVVALYAPDAVLLPTLSNRVRHDSAGIGEYFTGFLQRRPVGRVDESHVRVMGDMAINSGVYTFTLTGEDGEVSDTPCRFTFVYRRDGDGWKIVEHHSSKMPE